MSVVAIVPARGGSKGLPGKNRRYLNDKHLLAYPIEAALNAKCVDAVYFTTENKVLAELAEYYGARVIDRPAELATDEATSADVILHALEWVGRYKYFVYLEPTSPLTEASDVDRAFEMLKKNRHADAIVGVSKLWAHHPYFTVKLEGQFIKPYVEESFASFRRQEVEELYFLDGSLYISSVKAFEKHKTFYHDRTMAYVTPKWQSYEIDDHTDFVVVEAIAKELVRRRDEGEHIKLV